MAKAKGWVCVRSRASKDAPNRNVIVRQAPSGVVVKVVNRELHERALRKAGKTLTSRREVEKVG